MDIGHVLARKETKGKRQRDKRGAEEEDEDEEDSRRRRRRRRENIPHRNK